MTGESEQGLSTPYPAINWHDRVHYISKQIKHPSQVVSKVRLHLIVVHLIGYFQSKMYNDESGILLEHVKCNPLHWKQRYQCSLILECSKPHTIL